MRQSMQVELQGRFAAQLESISQLRLKQGRRSNSVCCEQLLISNIELRVGGSDAAMSSLRPAITFVR